LRGGATVTTQDGVYHGFDPRLWRLDLSSPTPAWTEVALSGTAPMARVGHSLVVDPNRRELILFGGGDRLRHDLADVWTYSLKGGASWTALAPSGSSSPGGRCDHAA